MKKLILFVICLSFLSLFITPAFAELLIDWSPGDESSIHLTTVSVDAQGNYVYTVTLMPEHQKILEWQVLSPLKWIDNAIVGKVTNSSKRMLLELSDKRPEKISKQEKKDLIKNSNLKTRKEKIK